MRSVYQALSFPTHRGPGYEARRGPGENYHVMYATADNKCGGGLG